MLSYVIRGNLITLQLLTHAVFVEVKMLIRFRAISPLPSINKDRIALMLALDKVFWMKVCPRTAVCLNYWTATKCDTVVMLSDKSDL